jgi:hypothetical protein
MSRRESSSVTASGNCAVIANPKDGLSRHHQGNSSPNKVILLEA